MARYILRGYTSSNPDFTDVIEFDGDLEAAFSGGDRRYNVAWTALKRVLLDSEMPSDYFDVFDMSDFEVREDLADRPGQVVFLAASYGCDNCQESDWASNDWRDGCDDGPHGDYMLTFDVEVA